ncbi:uncharacterized protein N7484_004881 [Penicillium longicatenatum]|uniref:uncharacterized protein n=1 Tax=Penicillium longicatenatum TaxID=1561947 RepID=UPI0025498CDF|nr:uncharacterized protein N7484_004881 [Penicillium longicatenatum]KAJ5651158.1 hypothetical protein N7484_004881 [Penicillium longicatenatum]
MAALNRLPYELLSSVNRYAADWVGLESLLQVSPQLGKLFAGESDNANPEAIRLVESILKENSIMSHELHRYFRMTMELRQPSLADRNLAEFMARDHSRSRMASSSINRATLQEMVKVAANIQRLACACLTTLLTRLRKVQPRRWEGELQGARLFKVTGTAPYKPRDAGPPSWIEEYRVYRALWHVLLCSDLLVAADRLEWPQSDLDLLRSDYIGWNQLPYIATEEIRSVRECLDNLFGADIDQTTQLLVESKSSDKALVIQVPYATQLLCKFDVWSPPPTPPRMSITRDLWGQGYMMTEENPMFDLWRSWQIRSKTHPARHQVYSLQDSRLWRALGMPIWDLWRFYGLGLWKAQWPMRQQVPILTPNGMEVSIGADPPFHGEDIGYRFSVFIEARVQMERQEKMERIVEDTPARE